MVNTTVSATLEEIMSLLVFSDGSQLVVPGAFQITKELSQEPTYHVTVGGAGLSTLWRDEYLCRGKMMDSICALLEHWSMMKPEHDAVTLTGCENGFLVYSDSGKEKMVGGYAWPTFSNNGKPVVLLTYGHRAVALAVGCDQQCARAATKFLSCLRRESVMNDLFANERGKTTYRGGWTHATI